MERRILGPEDRDQIKYDHEKIVADFLFDTFPNTHLYYERRPYEVKGIKENTNEEVVISSTLPDFELEDVEQDRVLMVVEVTRSRSKKAKEKQRSVMAKALPEVPYFVLIKPDIEAIKNRYNVKGDQFLTGRKIYDD